MASSGGADAAPQGTAFFDIRKRPHGGEYCPLREMGQPMRTMYLCIVIEETALPTRGEIEEIMRLSIDLAHLSPDRILLGKSSVPHKLRPFIARQVALAERQWHKFPSLAKCPFLLPTERAFEQASGEPLARHKQRYVMPETVLMDGTGGLGIDFLFMSACARQADYYEQDQLPYVAACRNLPY